MTEIVERSGRRKGFDRFPAQEIGRPSTLHPREVDLHLCYPSFKARPIDEKAVATLAASIDESGLLQPIMVRRIKHSRAGQMCDAYEVIAGMHRVKAFRRLQRESIPAVIVEMDDLHAELALIDENLCRNDLTPSQRAAAQARRKAIWQQIYPETRNHAAGNGRTKDQLVGQNGQANAAPRYDEAVAEATGHSERSIRRDVTRGEALGEDVLAKVSRTSLDKGDELDALAKLAPEVRNELATRAAAGESISAKAEAKKRARLNREAALGARQTALPSRRYGVIYADPEWRFEPYSRDTGMDRAPDNHYPTSPLAEICARNVAKIAAPDCVLFLWATVPMLPEAFCVLDAWGFARFERDAKSGFLTLDKRESRYVSSGSWVKYKPGVGIGLGHWFRVDHEILLVATRGNVPAPAHGEQARSVFDEPASRVHSQKPHLVYEIIESYFPSLPKIELNARQARPGWDAWGNEAPMATVSEAINFLPRSLAPTASVQDDMLDIPAFLRRGDPACPFEPRDTLGGVVSRETLGRVRP